MIEVLFLSKLMYSTMVIKIRSCTDLTSVFFLKVVVYVTGTILPNIQFHAKPFSTQSIYKRVK